MHATMVMLQLQMMSLVPRYPGLDTQPGAAILRKAVLLTLLAKSKASKVSPGQLSPDTFILCDLLGSKAPDNRGK